MDRTHPLAIRIERHFLNAGQRRFHIRAPETGLGGDDDQGAFGRIADDAPDLRIRHLSTFQRRVVAEQRAAEQRARNRVEARVKRFGTDEEFPFRCVSLARNAQVLAARPDLHHCHRVLRQRAGLVRANHRRAAECLDCRQLPDQRVMLDHPLHAEGQADGDDRRQPLGHGGNGEAHCGHEQVDDRRFFGHQIGDDAGIEDDRDVCVADDAVQEDQCADHQARGSEQFPEFL